jgi:hypothetical protein
VTVAASAEDTDVLITVSDTGHGISPEDLRPHLRAFYTTKGRGKGTGLGPGHLPPAHGRAGRHDLGAEPARQGLDVLCQGCRAKAAAPTSTSSPSQSQPHLRIAGGRA